MAATSSLHFTANAVKLIDMFTIREEFDVVVRNFIKLVELLFSEIPKGVLYRCFLDNKRMVEIHGGTPDETVYHTSADRLITLLLLDVKTFLGRAQYDIPLRYLGYMFDTPDKKHSLDHMLTHRWTEFNNAYMRFRNDLAIVAPTSRLYSAFLRINGLLVVLRKVHEKLLRISESSFLNLEKIKHVYDTDGRSVIKIAPSAFENTTQLDLYMMDTFFVISGLQDPCIVLRMLVHPYTSVATPGSVIPIKVGSTEYFFSLEKMAENGVYLEAKKLTGSGRNSATLFACGDEEDECDTVTKITHVLPHELFAAQHAALAGFGPKFVNKTFTVIGLDSASSRHHFTVYSMFRLDYTLVETLRNNEFIKADVEAIFQLLVRFENANFVHHDLKTDNIMVWKDDTTGRRRWYIIDYGVAWYGGKRYDPERVTPNFDNSSVPYGWDLENGHFYSRQHYRGWPRMSFQSRPPKFDACSLIAHLAFFLTGPDLRILALIDKFVPYIRSHLIMRGNTLVYRHQGKENVIVPGHRNGYPDAFLKLRIL